jgi:hypothetical protein
MARPPLLFLMIMPVHPMRWTHEQFDEMSWHDNHVHSLRVLEGENGAGELLLDLDYILEWLKCTDSMRFDLVPATLRFTGVTNLRIFLDYASPSARRSAGLEARCQLAGRRNLVRGQRLRTMRYGEADRERRSAPVGRGAQRLVGSIFRTSSTGAVQPASAFVRRSSRTMDSGRARMRVRLAQSLHPTGRPPDVKR